MFERLRKALDRAAKTLAEKVSTKQLSEKDIDEVMDDLSLELLDANVALEALDSLRTRLKGELVGKRIPRGTDVETYVIETLRDALLRILDQGSLDIVTQIRETCSKGRPYVIVFFGVNGVGKTTTIAKLAYMLKGKGLVPVIAETDTFRAGAQEQLRAHAEKLGVPFIGGQYGSDPASVAYDAISYASSRGHCAVLVDTAGRMHIDSNLMDELRKVVRVSKPDLRVLVVDALTGNDAVEQARAFEQAIGYDGVIVTKLDADEKGGTIISVAVAAGKPIYMVGVGQRYEDLETFDAKDYVSKLLGLAPKA